MCDAQEFNLTPYRLNLEPPIIFKYQKCLSHDLHLQIFTIFLKKITLKNLGEN